MAPRMPNTCSMTAQSSVIVRPMSDRTASLRAAAARKHAEAIARKVDLIIAAVKFVQHVLGSERGPPGPGCRGNGSTNRPNYAVRSSDSTPLGIAAPPACPSRTRVSASLRQRISALCEENRRLRDENYALKDELAITYGQQHVQGQQALGERLGVLGYWSSAPPQSVPGQRVALSFSGSNITRASASSSLPVSFCRSPGGRDGSARAERSPWCRSASTAKNVWSRPA